MLHQAEYMTICLWHMTFILADSFFVVFRDTSWHCVSYIGYIGSPSRIKISFHLELLHQFMKHFFWMWCDNTFSFSFYVFDMLCGFLFWAKYCWQAQTLRDTFPASDKSLGRLLGEVPYLSDGALNLLESLCCPESKETNDKDFQSGDRVTQGLSAVWNLILLRPANQDRCLQIALKVCNIVLMWCYLLL